MGKGPALKGYKKIRAHFVFDVKHNGRHKDRLVANGNLTNADLSRIYSEVVSLRGIRLFIFLDELDRLETWGTDIEKACLEALVMEKIFIKSGPEFGSLQCQTLIINKALYRLSTSGLR